MVHTEESRSRFVVITWITQGHGSAIGIGSFDSSQCKGTLVRDPGPGSAAGGSSWGHGVSEDSYFI